ncbi:MAG TPA: hypothetical protein VEW48_24275 [Thermoanaerobaculia bacterium]|nr:hypothetical protein [Thermoanaerobaculia bacterium]
MTTKQAVQEMGGEWAELEFDEVFWFTIKAEGRQEPGVFDLGTAGCSYSSSFEMTVSQDRPVRLELVPLGTTITIYNEKRFPAVMEAAG